jgi:hypothetical protein
MMTATGGSPALWAFAEHEHRDLVRGINRLHEVACEIGRRPVLELSVDVLHVVDWLDGTLAPHVAWEENWLYAEIDRRLGTPWATRAARFDHQQIRVMAARLRVDHHLLTRGASNDPQVETRCHLLGLEALLRAHVEREERFLIPILDDASYASESAAPLVEPTR